MQHVTRTHCVDLDWTFERINKIESVAIKGINTKDLISHFNQGTVHISTAYDRHAFDCHACTKSR